MNDRSILLVEDNAGDVRLTREALREAEVAVELTAVPDGEQALAFLRNEGEHAGARRPDLILLDLNLPKKNGLEVLEEIKGDPDLRHTPVIMLTTSSSGRDIAACYGAASTATWSSRSTSTTSRASSNRSTASGSRSPSSPA